MSRAAHSASPPGGRAASGAGAAAPSPTAHARIEISSADDPRVADFTSLKDAALRRRRGLFVVEGRRNVEVLVRSARHETRAVLVSTRACEALAPLWRELPAAVPLYVAPREVLAAVVGFDLHRGCLALAKRREPDPLDTLAAAGGVLVAIEELRDVDNVGSVFRNAHALGAQGVLLSPGCADPFYRKAVRVSMGAVLRLPCARARTWPQGADALAGLRARGFDVVALDPGEGAVEIAGARATPGARVRIPMVSGADSLNVATAVAVALAHFVPQFGRERLA